MPRSVFHLPRNYYALSGIICVCVMCCVVCVSIYIWNVCCRNDICFPFIQIFSFIRVPNIGLRERNMLATVISFSCFHFYKKEKLLTGVYSTSVKQMKSNYEIRFQLKVLLLFCVLISFIFFLFLSRYVEYISVKVQL